jgi:FkbM family methyltransferase
MWEHEHLRYEYDLDENSVVFDLGGYEGLFSRTIHDKYKCKNIYCFEPIKKFADMINVPDTIVYNYGLGKNNRNETLSISKDSTGMYASGEQESVTICDIESFIDKKIDLMKINIEGMEYELLERIIELGMQKNIKNIQVQFHRVGENYDDRIKKIQNELSKTHELTYSYPYIWENWKQK